MTREEWKSMTPDEQRIKVAELCGWVREDRKPIHVVQLTPEGWLNSSNGGWYGGQAHDVLPDYLNDLNAMHDAEDAFTVEQQILFEEHLVEIVENWKHCNWLIIHATATQRAEAFVLAMDEE